MQRRLGGGSREGCGRGVAKTRSRAPAVPRGGRRRLPASRGPAGTHTPPTDSTAAATSAADRAENAAATASFPSSSPRPRASAERRRMVRVVAVGTDPAVGGTEEPRQRGEGIRLCAVETELSVRSSRRPRCDGDRCRWGGAGDLRCGAGRRHSGGGERAHRQSRGEWDAVHGLTLPDPGPLSGHARRSATPARAPAHGGSSTSASTRPSGSSMPWRRITLRHISCTRQCGSSRWASTTCSCGDRRCSRPRAPHARAQ